MLGEVLTVFCVRSARRFRSIRTRRLTLGLPFLDAREHLRSRATRCRHQAHYRNVRRELLSADCVDLFVQSRRLDENFRVAYGVQHGQHFENPTLV